MYKISFKSRPYKEMDYPSVKAAADSDPSVKKSLDMAWSRFRDADFGKENEKANIENLMNREGYLLGRYGTRAGDIVIVLFYEDTGEDSAVSMFADEWEELKKKVTEEGR